MVREQNCIIVNAKRKMDKKNQDNSLGTKIQNNLNSCH